MRALLKLTLLLAPCVLASPSGGATPRVLKTRFTFTTSVPAAPAGTKSLRLWIPAPSTNPLQVIGPLDVVAPGPHRVTTETENGNRMVVVDLDPGRLPATVTISCDVERRQAGEDGPLAEGPDPESYLDADHLVPITGRYAEIGREVAGSKTGAVEKMRAIYDHVVATMQYDYKKESPKLGAGDVAFVCDYKKGNCSDLHSYVIALARSQGIPAYLEYGFPLTGIPVPDPVPITGKIGGYHCWTWFHVDGRGWLPLDASDGRRWLDSSRPDVKETLATKLVLERSAIAVSRGRDVTLEPPQAAGPLNTFIAPHAEADGVPVEATWTASYELKAPDDLQAQVAELRKLVIAQQAEIDKLKGERDAAKAVAPKAPAGTSSGELIAFYGQARVDVIRDASEMNSTQSPQWVKSPDDPTTDGDGDDQSSIHPRLTRIGLNLKAPPGTLEGWSITGKVELDFQGGGSESRATPRARLLFADFAKGPHAWRVGQDWDLVSPLFPSANDDTLQWNAGNLGDRRPQVRYTFDRGKGFSAATALVQTGAVDAKDLDNDGTRDGEDSGAPGVQLRLGWKSGKGASFGAWALRGWEETRNDVGGERSFTTSAYGVDFVVPFNKKLDLRGEAWGGRNLSDVRGGIGQGINTATGRGISARGGWLELGVNPLTKYRVAAGVSVDNPDDEDLPGNGRGRNRAYFLHNKLTLANNLDLGANVMFWETEHLGARDGKNRRLNIYLARKF